MLLTSSSEVLLMDLTIFHLDLILETRCVIHSRVTDILDLIVLLHMIVTSHHGALGRGRVLLELPIVNFELSDIVVIISSE